MASHLPLHLVGRLLLHLLEGPIPLHGVIKPGNMHEAIAMGPGHLRIHERHDLAGIIDYLARYIYRGAERAIAILVGG